MPAMPCVADYKGEPHRPKTAPLKSHSWATINACVARPVSRKEILQSPPALASMKAEWDRLRDKMVWDEDKVREWSDVAREAQKGNYEFLFISVTCSEYVSRGTLNYFPFVRIGSLQGELCSKIGKLQSPKT